MQRIVRLACAMPGSAGITLPLCAGMSGLARGESPHPDAPTVTLKGTKMSIWPLSRD